MVFRPEATYQLLAFALTPQDSQSRHAQSQLVMGEVGGGWGVGCAHVEGSKTRWLSGVVNEAAVSPN